jgi:hypothetical protein
MSTESGTALTAFDPFQPVVTGGFRAVKIRLGCAYRRQNSARTRQFMAHILFSLGGEMALPFVRYLGVRS